MNTITRDELKRKIDQSQPFSLLEILPFPYYQQGHLPGALNMPLDQVDAIASILVGSQNQEIVVYCASAQCSSSHQAAQRLTDLGYHDVKVYPGGKEDWIKAQFPIVTS